MMSRGAAFRRHSTRIVLVLGVVLGCRDQRSADPGRVLATSLEREIGVAEDMRVFTLFALLNAAGYDQENREAGMHPVRVQIRSALGERLAPALSAAVREFYTRHADSADTWSYSVVAMATSGPPGFEPTAEWTQDLAPDPQFGALAELHDLLRRFYAEADIATLYERVRPAYQEYIRQYREAILRETAAALDYCRLAVPALTASGERQNPVVIPNLLDSYEHAFSFVLENHFLSIEGPQQRIGYNPHEFMHAVTNPAVYAAETRAMADSLRPVLEAATRALGSQDGYRSVEAFVDECLVRAISLRYPVPGHPEAEAKRREAMLAEYRSGYILEDFFWEQLEAYERADVDLRRYYPQMLRKLDAVAELQRWNRQASPRSGE